MFICIQHKHLSNYTSHYMAMNGLSNIDLIMYILHVECIGSVIHDDRDGGEVADEREIQSKSNNKYDSLNINWNAAYSEYSHARVV